MRTLTLSSRENPGSANAFALHRGILRLSLSISVVFAWIFAFQYFYLVQGDLASAVARTALLYALANAIVCVVTPLGARSLRHGMRSAIFISIVALSLGLIALAAVFAGLWGPTYLPLAFVLFSIALGLYRSFYWVPYEIESRTGAGRPLGWELVIAFGPLVAGLLIAGDPQAPEWLLLVAAAGAVLSAFALPGIRQVHERFSWGYRETYHRLVGSGYRPLFARAFCEGIIGGALLFFWPLVIFLITGWSYGLLGIVLTLTFLVALFVRTLVRTLLSRVDTRGSRVIATILVVSPWLLRTLVATPLGVVFVDSFFYTTTPQRFGIDPFIFEQVSDGGSLLDEYTALKEISLAFGRTVICIAGALCALAFSVPIAFVSVFVTAAVASGALALFVSRAPRRR